MSARTQADYERYEYHPIVSRLQTFASEDLGAFYLDILKDRLYTRSRIRSSAVRHSPLVHDHRSLLKLMAPLLSFTAEEAWKVLKKRTGGNDIHRNFAALPALTGEAGADREWNGIRSVRAEVHKRLEQLRERGGSAHRCRRKSRSGEARGRLLQSLGDDLKFILITSGAWLSRGRIKRPANRSWRHRRAKCERCWHWRTDVGRDARIRCADAA